jgi:hypothetical protein
MSERICPFGATLVSEDFGCRRATRIIRRGGAEIACDDAGAHARCHRLHQRLKDIALPEFGVADDLLEIPHGVRNRVQYGGLAGLQRLLDGSAETPSMVADIDGLVQSATERYAGVDTIPCAELLADITAWKTRRRRGRRR